MHDTATNTRLSLMIAAAAMLLVAPASGQAPQPSGAPPLLSTAPTPADGAIPQPSQMSGLPLQVSDLPPGAVSVRVIRRTFADNVPGQEVHLAVGAAGRVLTATTDGEGRAVFRDLPVGEMVRARATVAGEALASQYFELPARGGVRLVLVAGIGAGAPDSGWTPAAAAAAGTPAADGSSRGLLDAAIIGTFFVFTAGAIGFSMSRNRRHIPRTAGRRVTNSAKPALTRLP